MTLHSVIKLKPLLISILGTLAVGGISTLLAGDIKGTYTALNLPSFAPPSWLFPVVWTILYLMIGLAAYLVWTAQTDLGPRKSAIELYVVQLLFNIVWMVLFFRLSLRSAAFVTIVILIILAVWTAVAFYRIKPAAGYLMLPYIAWLLFASLLNYAINQLN